MSPQPRPFRIRHRFFFSANIILIVMILLRFPSPASCKDVNIVDLYGRLKVEGNRLINQKGQPIALRGMSLFWSQWIGKYYNYECMKWLRDDWKCTVVRAAVAVESGGYLTNPDAEVKKVKTVIDACIDLGMYVIIDWHDHNAQNHLAEAKLFFKTMAAEYGEEPNILYEIYNEPTQVSWDNVVKPYSEAVIQEIRAIDPDNLIIVGTPTWSQDVDVAAANPIKADNLAYALHFYAATHRQFLRDKAANALSKGMALFVSEFGTCESTGSGVLDYAESQKWFDFMDANMLSWCNWSIEDKTETTAALKNGASATGKWASSDLTDSGKLARDKIIAWNQPILTSLDESIVSSEKMSFIMMHNYPNPFNSSTTIAFHLASPQQVRMDVYNTQGQRVAALLNQTMPSGDHRILFDSDDLPSGTYIYTYRVKGISQYGRMELIK